MFICSGSKSGDFAQRGVIFVKGAEGTVAAIYKGVVIAYGKAEIVALQLKKALNKLRGKELEKYLDELEELAGMAENIKTRKNVDLFLASAERLASLNITAKNALKYLDEALVHFNHEVIDGVVVKIGDNNCLYVVQAVEEYLKTGKILKVIPSKPQSYFKLEEIYNNRFLTYKIPSLQKVMKEGERGIIYGDKGVDRIGHVFNVIKKDGELLFKDGQSGFNANLKDGYIQFKYLKTN